MKKCDYCDDSATHETTLSTSENPNQDIKKSVCFKHYLEFEHGIVTVQCNHCKQPTLLEDDHYYNLEKIFCAHCGQLMENKEWIHRIKTNSEKE